MRPEEPADDVFLLELFCEARPHLMLLPDPMRPAMQALQYRAQAASYAARYPVALRVIVLLDGESVGRVLVDAAGDGLHLVDFAIMADRRGKGLGGIILTALTDIARAASRPIRLYVSTANPGALRLYLRHGFREVKRDVANIEMEWH